MEMIHFFLFDNWHPHGPLYLKCPNTLLKNLGLTVTSKLKRLCQGRQVVLAKRKEIQLIGARIPASYIRDSTLALA